MKTKYIAITYYGEVICKQVNKCRVYPALLISHDGSLRFKEKVTEDIPSEVSICCGFDTKKELREWMSKDGYYKDYTIIEIKERLDE